LRASIGARRATSRRTTSSARRPTLPVSWERRRALAAQIEAARLPEGSLLDDYAQELRRSARELGVAGVQTGVEPLLEALAGGA
jgi:hypothetical protein